MRRRRFIASSLAASAALGLSKPGPLNGEQAAAPSAPGEGGREYYELRRYQLRNGPQVGLVNSFFQDAFIPAANRLGLRPIGALTVVAGAASPSLYVLVPATSLETLVRLDSRLASDPAYVKAGSAFLEAAATAPAYERMESSLMLAFEGWPRIQPPATSRPRTFELRT